MEKSRKDRRKEARLVKKTMQCKSWVNDQKLRKKQSPLSFDGFCKKRKVQDQSSIRSDKNVHISKKLCLKAPDVSQVDRFKESMHGDRANFTKTKGLSKTKKREKSVADRRKSKTKFEEYLEMEMNKGAYAVDDLKMEEKLAKKLKVRHGKLGGSDDGVNELLDYVSEVVRDHQLINSSGFAFSDRESVEQELDSASESLESESDSDSGGTNDEQGGKENDDIAEETHDSSAAEDAFDLTEIDDVHSDNAEIQAMTDAGNLHKETAHDDFLSSQVPSAGKAMKYIAPHLRSHSDDEAEKSSQAQHQIRGLLNRLAESNVESVTKDVSVIIQSFGRNRGTQMVSEEVLASCSRGPRGNEQYAAVFAAFIAGMASSVGIDFGAKVLASIARTFEEEYLKEDSLSLRNLALLLSQLCIFGVCSSDLIYDLLSVLSKRMMELDVSTILTILQCCGMKLRSDDATAMKNFILSVQQRVQELKSPSEGATPNGHSVMNSKRMDFMLEMICDIKNNKKKPKEDSPHHVRLKKWLQKLRVEEIQLRGLKWSKFLDPQKKGQWWLSGDITPIEDSVAEIADRIDSEALEAQKLLQLASAQRMNTEARRAIFCVIMSGEDYMDAFEKILRLDLPGKQDREIMRVLVDCCLQEKVFNKYYSVLASKLCSYDKNHKFTLQYCLWDHFKQLDVMELRRSVNLARFVAEMLASFSLSLAFLKVVEFSEPRSLTPKRVMHFRLVFESVFAYSDEQVWNIFTRIASIPELEALREGIQFFLKRFVLGMASNEGPSLARKFKTAKKALHNVAGILK